MRTIRLIPFILGTSIFFLSFPMDCKAGASKNAGRWSADLDLFAKELPARHIDLFFQLSEEKFLRQVEALKTRSGDMEDYEVVVVLMKIVASIGDSHTMLSADKSGIFHKLPVTLRWFSDGLYAVETIPEYRAALGKRLTGIEGKSIEQVNDLIRTVVSHENPSQFKIRAPQNMVIPEILAALDITTGLDSAAFTFEGIGTVAFKPVAMHANLNWISCLQNVDCELPLYLQHADSMYWYRHLENEKTVYAHYRSCGEMKGRPFVSFARELFSFIDSHDIERFIFDMRLNGGGNSVIARPVIEGVKQRAGINQNGNLFVIIGRDTYSSAILNALEFQNETHALFAGEATGGKPNHYGEVKFFLLPRTWLVVTYSTKYFTHSRRDTPSLIPDMEIGLTFSDYTSCRDPVMEAILNYR